MVTKKITYTDYKGNQRTEELYFNLNKAELVEMELSTEGGLHAMLLKIKEAEDMPQIVKVFKQMILKSYGVISNDGRRFTKSPELSEEFSQTEAYSELFMELASNPDEAAAFVNGVIPAEMALAAEEAEKKGEIAQFSNVAEAKAIAADVMRSGN